MYDSLLEDFDEEAVRTPEEEEGFTVQAVADIDIVDDDAELDVAESTADVEVPLKLDEEDLLSLGDDGESWSDDPVRMYLTQMGEIPLLTRALAPELWIEISDTLDDTAVECHVTAKRITLDAVHLQRILPEVLVSEEAKHVGVATDPLR